jgi:hypothetical protein
MAGLSARTTDPETSQEAGSDTEGRSAIRVLLLREYAEALLALGDGLTDHEAMVLAGFDPRDGHWRRCSDLRSAGLITQVISGGIPVTRVSERTGKRQMVCTVTDAGIDTLRNIA